MGASSREVLNNAPALQASDGYPSGLTIGPDGDLYFPSGSSHQTLRLTTSAMIKVAPSFREVTNLGGSLQPYPAELVFDKTGDLYVSTGDAFRLVELTRSGQVLSTSAVSAGAEDRWALL